MNAKKLVKQPTIENLTEFAVEKAARLVAKSERIPITLYSIGDCMVNGLKFTGLPDAKVELKPDGWRLESSAVLKLLEKLRKIGKPLGEFVEGRFYNGVKSGHAHSIVGAKI